MTLAWLLGAYVVVGLLFGWRAWARGGASVADRVVSTALATSIWPLWAPFLVEGPRRPAVVRGAGAIGLEVTRAIDAAREACVEAALDPVFSEQMAVRLRGEVERSVVRIEALERTLDAPLFDPGEAEAHAQTLEGAVDRGRLASASLHARNVRRMRALLEADLRALRELVELLRALRSQLALARFVGASEADASGIVSEVWSRVEGLGAVIEPERLTTTPTGEERA